jgi:cell pole-organizing protein PopZ
MADPKNQPSQEPSMEEILASIRRIISEDGETKAAPGATPAPRTAASGSTAAAAHLSR